MAALVIAALLPSALARADAPPAPQSVAAVVEAYRAAREPAILDEYFALLRLPNDSSSPEDIRRNADHIAGMLARRDITARILDTGEGAPAVYGERLTPGAERTVVFYVHYDGQPVAAENWNTPPFEPVVKTGFEARGGQAIARADLAFPLDPELRIFARSASDDKAPLIALMTAIDALDDAGIAPSVNMKFFFEGEEERGSPHLPRMLAEYGHLLTGDLLLFLDGPVHQSGRKTLTFGVRGVYGVDLTVYGPDRPLHSGHYGNFAPNPVDMLSDLLAGMRDGDGRVLIDGFYDAVTPPTEAEKAAIADLPEMAPALMEELALGRREHDGLPYEETILWPALNFKGIRAGAVGADARNIINPQARASVGVRLVPEQTPADMIAVFEAHLRAQGYHIVHDTPDAATRRAHALLARLDWGDDGYGPVRTPVDSPASQAVTGIMRALYGDELLLIPSMGGSLPIRHFTDALDMPVIILPIANADNNQHAENENIRIGNLWDGMEIYGALIATLGRALEGN